MDVFIGISYIFDVDFHVGKIYRGFLYAIGFISILMYNVRSFYVFISSVWVLYFLFWFLFSDNLSVSREISFFFKTTYLFIILHLINRVNFNINFKKRYLFKILKNYSKIIAFLVVFSFVTDIGIDTYGKWVFGTSSFFVAQNDIGLSQLLVFTFLLFNKDLVSISWSWMVLIFLSLIFLGTSTGMFGALAVVILYVFFKLVLANISSIKSFFIRFLSILILLGSFIFVSIHLYNYILESDYYSRKYTKILNGGVRSRLTNAGDVYFEDRGVVKNLLGEGFSSYTTNLGNKFSDIKISKRDYKDWLLIETDPYDLYGSFGLILMVLFLCFYVYYFLLSFLNYCNRRNVYNLSIFLVFSMAMFHSIMAGHVLYSPTVLGILAVFIFFINTEYLNKNV